MKKRWVILFSIFILIILTAIYWPNRWNYIVIHHSAGNYGNIEHLQDIHDQRQSKDPIHAISYHYIIGNGNGMEDGKVDSDIRKKFNLWGVHVTKNNWDRNFRGLGICIIGNLDKNEMTTKQYESLIKLTIDLMEEYNIDFENVGFHGKLSGESTKCPGKFFPYEKFKKDIKDKITFANKYASERSAIPSDESPEERSGQAMLNNIQFFMYFSTVFNRFSKNLIFGLNLT